MHSKSFQNPAEKRLGCAIILLPFVACSPSAGGPIGQRLPSGRRYFCSYIGENALDRLIEVKTGGACLGCGGAHSLDIEWLLPQDLVHMLPC
jgi:hypothetical protein